MWLELKRQLKLTILLFDLVSLVTSKCDGLTDIFILHIMSLMGQFDSQQGNIIRGVIIDE